MPLINTPQHRIFFAHVPKAGGSSVEDYLVRRFGGQLSILVTPPDAPRRRYPGVVVSPNHMSAEDLQDFLPHDLDFCFAVVRDPLARMISQYRFQTGVSWASRLSFSTWLRVMLACLRIDPRSYENHIRPQVDLIPEGAEIFRLEDGFEGLITRLDAVTGTTAPEIGIGHLLKGAKKAEIPITRQDVAAIESFYAEDYARFGYAPRDVSGLPDDRWASLRAVFGTVLARAVVWKQHRRWMR